MCAGTHAYQHPKRQWTCMSVIRIATDVLGFGNWMAPAGHRHMHRYTIRLSP